MKYAPIAFFVYNRLAHTKRALHALLLNELASESDLVIHCDGAKDAAGENAVREVREYVRSVRGFRSIRLVEQARNVGLANSIIGEVTRVCASYGRAIVVEDDLVTSPHFLRFMNRGLDTYFDEDVVGSIHGYWYPTDCQCSETFFLRGASCWGWATWSRAWDLFEADGRKLLAELRRRNLTASFDLEGAIGYTRMLRAQIAGRNDSWAIRWHASMFLAGKLQLSPGRSLVTNIGFDGTGTHCSTTESFSVSLSDSPIEFEGVSPEVSEASRAALIRYYKSTRLGIGARVQAKLRRALGK